MQAHRFVIATVAVCSVLVLTHADSPAQDCTTDSTPPTITCPGDISTTNTPGQCASVVSFPPPTVSDDCVVASTNCAPASGSDFTNGITVVTCAAVDAAGNTNTCAFTVTVNDAEPPALVCPTNLVVNTDAGSCTRSNLNYGVTATDNCPDVTLNCTPPSGTNLFLVGTHSVTCTATDAANHATDCVFGVTVVDAEPPAILCGNDVTRLAGKSESVTVDFPAPSATDNCSLVSNECAPPSGSDFPQGATEVICVAADSAGNTTECSFVVRVFDLCVQDDVTGDTLLISSPTGEYEGTWCAFETVITGTGELRQKGNKRTFKGKEPTSRVKAIWKDTEPSARAKLVFPTVETTVKIRDSDTSDNDCACP